MSPNPAILTWPRPVGGVWITNRVSNGDFSSGITGWGRRNVPSYSVADGVLTFAPSAPPSSVSDQNVGQATSTVLYSKYYYMGYLNGANTRVRVGWSNQVNNFCTTPGTWERKSGIWTELAATRSRGFGVSDQTVAPSGGTSQARWFMWIDLTSAFGAGNEPTAAEMDAALLAAYPTTQGFFKGTISINM